MDALERFHQGARAIEAQRPVSRPAMETKRLLEEGETFASIALIRGRQLSTVVNAVSELIESGQLEFKPGWVDQARQAEIEAPAPKSARRDCGSLKKPFPRRPHLKISA